MRPETCVLRNSLFRPEGEFGLNRHLTTEDAGKEKLRMDSDERRDSSAEFRTVAEEKRADPIPVEREPGPRPSPKSGVVRTPGGSGWIDTDNEWAV